MMLNILSRILTFLSNVSINKGNKLLFHRYDMFSLVFFFVAIIFWLDPNLRHWFNLLQVDVPWRITLGLGVIALPIFTTVLHIKAHFKSKGSIWYFGDGYGNIFEDIVRILAGTDYRSNSKKYIRASIIIRLFLLLCGLLLVLYPPSVFTLF